MREFRIAHFLKEEVPYYKISLSLLSRIIECVADTPQFAEDPKAGVKFSIAPYDLSLNYFIVNTVLAGERYIAVFAPSVSAEAYLIHEIACGADGLADDLRSVLGNVRYEEDRLESDGMVWMEASQLRTVAELFSGILTTKDNIIAVTGDEIRSVYGIF